VYGNDLVEWIDPAGEPGFYHADGLGSVRALSDLAGRRTDAYSCDAFGALRSHTGGAGQPFTFTGEQVDDLPGGMNQVVAVVLFRRTTDAAGTAQENNFVVTAYFQFF
jgi:hypothetical protein